MLKDYKKSIRIYKALKNIYLKESLKFNQNVHFTKKIIMPIFYWGNTHVSWLQIFFAVSYLKNGAEVFFIFDDNFTSQRRLALNFALVCNFIKILKEHPKATIILPKIRNSQVTNFDELIYKKHYFNAQWTQKRAIKQNSFMVPQNLLAEDRKVAESIDTVLKSENFDMCFCPGGIYGNSYLWKGLCDQNAIRFSSFDADDTDLVITPAGVAAHRTDVIHRCNKSSEEDEANFLKFVEKVSADIFKRSKLKVEKIGDIGLRQSKKDFEDELVKKFFAKYQKNIRLENVLQRVVIFLNTSWDSSALDLEPWKISQMDWLDLLVPELVQNGARQIIIRQHPDEKIYPSTDNYPKKIHNFTKMHPSVEIKLIEKFSNVSSYKLLQNATSVFTFSSTIGLEAMILNRPTFVFKDSYQTMLNSLPKYTSGSLQKNLQLFFENIDSYKSQSILAYYYGQLDGWEHISLPRFYQTLEDKEAVNRLNEIACEILNLRSDLCDAQDI